jgi:alanyl-tRNA synthetase
MQGVELEGESDFTGYTHLTEQSTVLALFCNGASRDSLETGEEGMVILDRTPFYAESGGQVGDRGLLTANDGVFEVHDTQKQGSAVLGHLGRVLSGALQVGDLVEARVNSELRQATALNHSATHLLHAALRRVLGDHVNQKGSLVGPERLRFDFSHFEPVTRDELREIERLVNREIRANHLVETRIMSLQDAKASGAMALFGEKYGEQVRVLRMGDFSTELCGGTHVNAVGDIGLFKITAETGIAAGVRRIEALTGGRAIDLMEAESERLQRIADLLRGGREDVDQRVAQLLERSRGLERELDQLKGRLAGAAGADLAAQARPVAGVQVLAARLDGADPKSLREILDRLKDRLGSGVIVLATVTEGKVSLVAGITKDLTDRARAGDLIRIVAERVGGKGGGRSDMAQAGGSDTAALPEALALVEPWVAERLGA